MRCALVVLAACGGGSGHAAHAPHREHAMPGEHRFEHAEQWTARFDDPARDGWQKPDEVIAALAIEDGMTVADVGAGTGYFASRLAKVAEHVLAVDIEPDMVRYLRERAERESTPNVEAILGAADDPNLPAAGVDRILIVDTWHHIGARVDYGKRLATALKPSGFVLVVDFTQESEMGPPRHHRVTPAQVIEELTAAGLTAAAVDETLPEQFIIRAARRALD